MIDRLPETPPEGDASLPGAVPGNGGHAPTFSPASGQQKPTRPESHREGTAPSAGDPDPQKSADSSDLAPADTADPPSQQAKSSSWRRPLKMILITYLGLCLMLAVLQRGMIYFPTREEQLKPEGWGLAGMRCLPLAVSASDGVTLHGWHVLPADASVLNSTEQAWELDRGRPVILFFSGNAGHRGYRADELAFLANLNADVFLFDYRGYAENSGRPSESALLADAWTIWRHLTGELGISGQRILLLGESLGGGVACGLAERLAREGVEFGGLFFKGSFSSLADVASHHYPWLPVRLLLLDRYESAQRIASVTAPIAVLHGGADDIIPLKLAEKLHAAAPETSTDGLPKRFHLLPDAGHNDIHLRHASAYRSALTPLLDHIRQQ